MSTQGRRSVSRLLSLFDDSLIQHYVVVGPLEYSCGFSLKTFPNVWFIKTFRLAKCAVIHDNMHSRVDKIPPLSINRNPSKVCVVSYSPQPFSGNALWFVSLTDSVFDSLRVRQMSQASVSLFYGMETLSLIFSDSSGLKNDLFYRANIKSGY